MLEVRKIHHVFLAEGNTSKASDVVSLPTSHLSHPTLQAAETGDKDVDCRGQPRRKAAGEPSHI